MLDLTFHLLLQGRFLFVQGQCREASEWYARANAAQSGTTCTLRWLEDGEVDVFTITEKTDICVISEWPQFHHVASWEMMWASSYELEWRGALLQVGSHWWRRVT